MPDLLAYPGKRSRESQHTVEFRLIANLAVLGMIAILATAASVYASRLQMTVCDGANPDLLPRGWNDKGADTP
jgi:hypothetical protein